MAKTAREDLFAEYMKDSHGTISA